MTCTFGRPNALTLDKIKEAIEQLEKLPPIPKFIFSRYVPSDEIYHGRIIDEMAKRIDPFFNPKRNKAYLVNIKYKEMLTNIF